MYYLHKNKNNKKIQGTIFLHIYVRTTFDIQMSPNTIINKKNFIIQATAHNKVCISEM